MEYHLHIGAHRTGTTATQKLLESRSAQLHSLGVAFLGPDSLRGWGLYDLIQRMTDGHAPSTRVEDTQAVLWGMALRARPATRLVISDENLSGSMMQNYTLADLYPEAKSRFEALGLLLPASPDVVHVTIRDLVGYWQSTFAHLAMRGRVDTFDAGRLANSLNGSWLPFLEAVRCAFPKAKLRVQGYDRWVVNRLVSDLVGPELAAKLPAPKRSFGLALTDDIIAGLPSGPEREARSLELREARDTPDRMFSPDQAEKLRAAYDADWKALRSGHIAEAVLDPVHVEEACLHDRPEAN